MLFYLLYPLSIDYSFFNVFKYISFRTFGASITSVLLCMALGPSFIRFLQRKQIGQSIRSDGPQSHQSKSGTPTMGGVLILMGIVIPTLLWADLGNVNIWIALITTMVFGAIGFADDYLKVIKKNSKGLSPRQKMFLQVVAGFGAGYALFVFRETPALLKFPFFKDLGLELGWLYIPFSVFVIVGASNAVNLTDGLDGLAVGPSITTAVTFLILAYCAGHIKIAEYYRSHTSRGQGSSVCF